MLFKLESRVGLEANFLKWFHHTCLIERFSWNWLIVPLPLWHSTRLYFSSLSIFSKHATSGLYSAKTWRVFSFLHRWYSNLSTNQKKQFHCDYFSSAMFRGNSPWLAQNVLFLNEDQTEVIVFSPNKNSQCISPELESLSVFRSSRVRILGVLVDQHLTFDKHIFSVIGSSFYQLHLLSKIKNVLTPKLLEMTVHAFVMSRQDYCRSLSCGISKSQIAHLQLVQNVADRLLLKCRKLEHINSSS